MKKILEVLQYGDTDIRFYTDIDVSSNMDSIPMISFQAAYAMMTKLWGGNEQSVIAMIRALAVADLAVCANREEMLKKLGFAAKDVADAMWQFTQEAAKQGIRITTFGPGAKPDKTKS